MEDQNKNQAPEMEGAESQVQGEDSTPQGEKQGEKPETKVFTEEEVQKMIKERLARQAKKFEGYDEMKKQLEELKKFKEEKELESMSEMEKLQKQLESLTNEKQTLLEQLQSLESQRKQERIDLAFKEAAKAANIQFIDAAYKLADLSGVEVDEEGNIVGIEDVVKNLVESNPFLVAVEKKKPEPIGGPSNPSNAATEKTAEQIIKELEEQYRKTQRPEDYVKLIQKKRELNAYKN